MADVSVLDAYLAGVDARAAPRVVELDDAVRAAHPDLDVAVKYRLLMYTLGHDWRRWVCAIGVTKKGVGLRFLYGVLLDDPRKVLRAGTSVLKTWDFGFDDPIDEVAVGLYVSEAVARYGEYAANEQEILEASRAASKRDKGPGPAAS